MEQAKAREQFVRLRAELVGVDLDAPDTPFSSLRAVDAKVREAKLLLTAAGLTQILAELERAPS